MCLDSACQNRAPRGFYGIFTLQSQILRPQFFGEISNLQRINRPANHIAKTSQPLCTKSCHPPVNQLHSIDNKPHADAIFSLTQILKGVQQDRSLTVSEVFPVGAASGARAKSLSHRKMNEGRQARVYSKALVEENKKLKSKAG
jgi:hypothetical protein